MHSAALDKLSDRDLLAMQARHFGRLSALYAGETLDRPFFLAGIGRATHDADLDWGAWLDRSLGELGCEADRSADANVFRPLCVNCDPYGVHFVDSMFGADVFRMADNSWQVRVLGRPVGELAKPDPDGCRAWDAATAFATAFLERDVPAVLLGLPTIASALNVAVNLYGQEFLIAMMTRPDAARHDLAVINDLLCDLHRWYRAHVPARQLQCVAPAGRCQPPGFGQLCGCSTQLLSPRQYDEFVAPLDEALLMVYPNGGMIHLCGAHTQHIPTWRAMRPLRAAQLNDRAAEDLPVYFRELRDDQVLYVNPCETMPRERILEVTGGRRIVLVCEPPASAGTRGR